MSRRSRTRDLRLPFVVTLAIGATACGGATSGGSGDGDNPSERGGSGGAGGSSATGGWVSASGGGQNPPYPETACPPGEPLSGAACNVDTATICGYGSDCGGSPTVQATCNEGAWVVYQVSCNPPPPVETVCPGVQPMSGDWCNVDPMLTCGYGNCYGTPTVEAKCNGYAWELIEWSCNPPMPECPVEVPSQESPCESGLDGPCFYETPCAEGIGMLLTAACSGTVWSVTSEPIACGVDAGPPQWPSSDGGPAVDSGW